MFLLLLSPLTAVLAAGCVCIHEEADTTTMSPVPCCGETPRPCCLHLESESSPVAEPLIPAPVSPRLQEPVLCELLSPELPIEGPGHKVVRSPRSERPPGGLCHELSFRQSWLI